MDHLVPHPHSARCRGYAGGHRPTCTHSELHRTDCHTEAVVAQLRPYSQAQAWPHVRHGRRHLKHPLQGRLHGGQLVWQSEGLGRCATSPTTRALTPSVGLRRAMRSVSMTAGGARACTTRSAAACTSPPFRQREGDVDARSSCRGAAPIPCTAECREEQMHWQLTAVCGLQWAREAAAAGRVLKLRHCLLTVKCDWFCDERTPGRRELTEVDEGSSTRSGSRSSYGHAACWNGVRRWYRSLQGMNGSCKLGFAAARRWGTFRCKGRHLRGGQLPRPRPSPTSFCQPRGSGRASSSAPRHLFDPSASSAGASSRRCSSGAA